MKKQNKEEINNYIKEVQERLKNPKLTMDDLKKIISEMNDRVKEYCIDTTKRIIEESL